MLNKKQKLMNIIIFYEILLHFMYQHLGWFLFLIFSVSFFIICEMLQMNHNEIKYNWKSIAQNVFFVWKKKNIKNCFTLNFMLCFICISTLLFIPGMVNIWIYNPFHPYGDGDGSGIREV